MDPTSSPTKSPTGVPTRAPTRPPTGAPTFELPKAGFVDTDVVSGETLYNVMKGADAVEVQIFLDPAPLVPVTMNWEILNSTGHRVRSMFNKTSGTVSSAKYKVNY